MKKVMQTTGGSTSGNCFQAAMASILELPLNEVPDYMNNVDDSDGLTWPTYLQNDMIEQGYCYSVVGFNGNKDFAEYIASVAIDTGGYFIACGLNLSGSGIHATVWNGDGFAHDPASTSIDTVTEYKIAYVIHKL